MTKWQCLHNEGASSEDEEVATCWAGGGGRGHGTALGQGMPSTLPREPQGPGHQPGEPVRRWVRIAVGPPHPPALLPIPQRPPMCKPPAHLPHVSEYSLP